MTNDERTTLIALATERMSKYINSFVAMNEAQYTETIHAIRIMRDAGILLNTDALTADCKQRIIRS